MHRYPPEAGSETVKGKVLGRLDGMVGGLSTTHIWTRSRLGPPSFWIFYFLGICGKGAFKTCTHKQARLNRYGV